MRVEKNPSPSKSFKKRLEDDWFLFLSFSFFKKKKEKGQKKNIFLKTKRKVWSSRPTVASRQVLLFLRFKYKKNIERQVFLFFFVFGF